VVRWHNRYIQRPVLAFFKMPGSLEFAILLLIFLAVMGIAVFELHTNYVDPDNGRRLDLFAALYTTFVLLAFETPLPFPEHFITRLVFLAVPVIGILILGHGLLRLGRNLLNKDLWNRAMASTYKDHTIVCGLGKVSLKVIRWILDLNEEAVVIEQRADNPYLAEVRSWGVPVIIADARRPEVLMDANIQQAESIVPCTNDDLLNLGIALEARKLAPGLKVVLRMFDTRMAENVREGFDIHTVFSIPEISAPAFAAAATRAPLDHAFAYGESREELGIVTITKFTVVRESSLVGYTVGRLEDEFEVAVIALRKDGKFILHPRDEVVLDVDDRFVASASIAALNTLAHLTPPTREMHRYLQGRWDIHPLP